MEKKYKQQNDETLMVVEPTVVYGHQDTATTISMPPFPSERSNLDYAISGQELKRRLHESLKSRFL